MSKNEKISMSENESRSNDDIPFVSLTTDEADEAEIEVVVEESGKAEKADAAQKRVDELYDSLARVTADYENYRRRNQESVKAAKEDGVREVFIKLLPVLDAVELGKKMVKDESVLSGLELIMKQFCDVMAQYGIASIEAIGEEFDPNLHNAVYMADDPKNAGRVVEVFQKGYMMGKRVLRHANVMVAK